MKECSMCHQSKPYSEFSKDRTKADGFHHRCKDCYKIYRQEYKIQPKIHRSHKTCNVCKIVKPIDDFSINRSTKDGYNYTCRTCNYERNLNRRSTDRAEHITHKLCTKASQNGIPGPRIGDIRNLLDNTFGDSETATCPLCKSEMFLIPLGCKDPKIVNAPDSATIDHILPLKRGGTYELVNLQFLCRTCNCHVKRNLTMEELYHVVWLTTLLMNESGISLAELIIWIKELLGITLRQKTLTGIVGLIHTT